MGVSLSWVGVGGKAQQEILDLLGLSRTEQYGDELDFPLMGLDLPSGWYLLVARGSDHALVSPEILERLSTRGSVVAVSVDENSLFSSASLWRDRCVVWKVEHRGSERGFFDLQVDGVPPKRFADLSAATISGQHLEGGNDADIDLVLEVPLELAKSIVGFKHDEKWPGVREGHFCALQILRNGLLARRQGAWWGAGRWWWNRVVSLLAG
jgi:hypothetical protein